MDTSTLNPLNSPQPATLKHPKTIFDTLTERYGLEEAAYLDTFRRAMWQVGEYEPTGAQAEWLFAPEITQMVAGGVRSGKSYSSVKKLDWILGKKDALIWILGPDYEQAMMEFDYIRQVYDPAGLLEYVSRPKEGACKLVVKGGATAETKSTADLTKIAGKAPDFILMVEAGQHHEDSPGKAYERGLEKNGFILMTGTFEGANTWYEDTYKSFQLTDNPIGGRSYSMPTWTNTKVFPGGRDDPKFERAFHGLSHAIFMERVAAVPYAMSGRVIRGLDRETHCVPLLHDRAYPVFICTDPATHTYPVLFVQRIGRRVHVLDEIYEHDVITQDILPIVKRNNLFPYVTAVIMDQAGKQRQANRAVAEIWRSELDLPILMKYVLVKDNIDACNLRLQVDLEDGRPNLLFNSTNIHYKRSTRTLAGGVLAEADLWRYAHGRNKQYRNEPEDKNNDAWKALGYFLFREFGPVVERRAPRRSKRRPAWYAKTDYYKKPTSASMERLLYSQEAARNAK